MKSPIPIEFWFSFLFLWLLLIGALQVLAYRVRPKHRVALVSAILSAVIILLPVGGIPLGRWLEGWNVRPSFPLLCFLAGLIWKNAGGAEIFRSRERLAGALFGGLVGTILYPLSLGLGNFDPYQLGWHFSFLFASIAALTLLLIWRENRFGFLLLLSIMAYDLRCLESINFWDYLIDPIYWLLSLLLLAKAALNKFLRGKTGARVTHACSSESVR